MEPGIIEYIAPTKRAFERMKDILFRPFNIQKWFILGFSAWLAALGDGGGSSGGGGSDFESGHGANSDWLAEAANWIEENLIVVVSIGLVVFAVIVAISLAVLWIQSRGKFMFLDNVIHDRTLISEPWKQFKDVANSLFRWKFIFVLIIGFGFLSLGGWAFYIAWPMIQEKAFNMDALPSLVIIGVLFIVLVLAISYISMLLENFVIPLMHRDGLPATVAWRKLLSLHRERTGAFVLFFLWMIVIGFLTGLAVIAIVLGTCCIALIPLIIPYLGTVLLLPLYVFMRLLGPEFLKQFGDDFDTLTFTVKTPPALN